MISTKNPFLSNLKVSTLYPFYEWKKNHCYSESCKHFLMTQCLSSVERTSNIFRLQFFLSAGHNRNTSHIEHFQRALPGPIDEPFNRQMLHNRATSYLRKICTETCGIIHSSWHTICVACPRYIPWTQRHLADVVIIRWQSLWITVCTWR